jgi:predicted O-methyltransferase YrrM
LSETFLAPALTPAAARLMEAVHGGDIYAGFSPIRALDLQGWNGTHPVLMRAVEEVKPSLAFDIGVWKGQSVASLSEAMRRVRPDSALLAIDTFLGSPGHWDRTRADRIVESLGLVHGWPSLYWQFLSNMVLSGHAERVVPLPQTSDNAAVILAQLRLRPELIHIDAAHEYEPVKRDIENYWALLRAGGIMIGDDYPWPGVKKAADEFAAAKGLPLEVDGPKWVLRKPA